jgi:hypothetical protein
VSGSSPPADAPMPAMGSQSERRFIEEALR